MSVHSSLSVTCAPLLTYIPHVTKTTAPVGFSRPSKRHTIFVCFAHSFLVRHSTLITVIPSSPMCFLSLPLYLFLLYLYVLLILPCPSFPSTLSFTFTNASFFLFILHIVSHLFISFNSALFLPVSSCIIQFPFYFSCIFSFVSIPPPTFLFHGYRGKFRWC
jgi:hypothetical protein